VLIASLVLAVVVGLVLWAGALGIDRVTPLAQLAAFRMQLALAALAAGAAVALVPLPGALAGGLVLVAVAVSPLPQLLARTVPRTGSGAGPRLTVLAANVQADRAPADVVARLVLAHRADVVVLPEASWEYARAVVGAAATAGVEYAAATNHPRTALSHDEQCPQWCGASTSLLVRAELEPVFDRARPMGSMGCLSARLSVPPHLVTVAAVHPLPPTPSWLAGWRADHEALGELCASATPTVIAGDFNATLDHSPLRALLGLGCRDAARVAGRGLTGTWPAALPWPLRIPIDHVLATPAAGAVARYETVDVPGTDHLGVLVVLVLP
jgi:endonuclease/exonuclease/phosphatase (EEP) superfamily protein YafD